MQLNLLVSFNGCHQSCLVTEEMKYGAQKCLFISVFYYMHYVSVSVRIISAEVCTAFLYTLLFGSVMLILVVIFTIFQQFYTPAFFKYQSSSSVTLEFSIKPQLISAYHSDISFILIIYTYSPLCCRDLTHSHQRKIYFNQCFNSICLDNQILKFSSLNPNVCTLSESSK